MNRLGCGNLYSDGGFPDHDADVRSNYIMNSSIQGADQADVVLLIGTNPRLEAPVFNARCGAACSAILAQLVQDIAGQCAGVSVGTSAEAPGPASTVCCKLPSDTCGYWQ